MNTLVIGQNFIELAETESTNSYASALLSVRPAEGTVVWAHRQSAGRGQQGNHWLSLPEQNLTFSIILYPTQLAAGQIFLLNKVFSCALHDFLQHRLAEATVRIKWPNDLLANGKKVAGMLLENQIGGSRVGSTVAGIGLNVNQVQFPEADYGTATSMALVAEREFDRAELLEDLLARIEARWLALRAGGTDKIERDYLHHLYGYQEEVELEIAGKVERRYLAGVDRHGRLALQDGRKLSYYNVKEVRFCL